MDFTLSEEQNMLVDTIRKMGQREKFRDLARHIDETGEFPFELLKKFSDLGLLGMTVSAEHGGGGQPAMNAILCIEELAKFSPMIAAPVFESNVGPVRVIDIFGTEEQKKTIVPGVCRGEYSVSVCMTEPEAGSDLTALTTHAVEDGDSYVLNGKKCFITGGGHASHYMVYTRFGDARGYKAIGGLLVDKGMKGFTFGKQEKFMGLHGMPSCDLYFDDVRVPKKNLVIQPGEFNKLMSTFDIERCGNAAMCLGLAGGAFEEARAYAMERKAFGRPICEFQAVQFMMVDMATRLDAARLLVYRAINGAGRGLPSIYEASMAKSYANEMVVEVTNLAMQVFGGYGYSREFPMERMYRDAKAWGVAGGTIQMLKIGIAGMIFGRRFDQRKG
ncbi:MAG: acyl-CoA dehydrogenase family protein [Spirochaetes bacterium]|nr:acyl-CoA dehydrogenase family protein [Spirochaetota bacterium]HOD13818.1 acyl-CoA dehydrogenase family protein [Spirochaetota bacterium]HPG50155.1 acyl-CoA dehydrogenase family protein [Spirochaetota bacterium]